MGTRKGMRGCPVQWFLSRCHFVPWGIFDNVVGHFLWSQLGGAAGILWVEAKDATKHPTTHRAAPLQRMTQTKMLTQYRA